MTTSECGNLQSELVKQRHTMPLVVAASVPTWLLHGATWGSELDGNCNTSAGARVRTLDSDMT